MKFKIGLTLLMLSISTSAFATCVDLSGNYEATQQTDGQTEKLRQTITQTADSIIFGEGADPLSLDQQEHRKEDGGNVGIFKLTCTEDSMVLVIKAQMADGNSVEQTSIYKKTESGYLETSAGSFSNETVNWTKVN